MPEKPKRAATPAAIQIRKCPTGIAGFDAVTEGGLPEHRTTLLSGPAGSGKTLFAIDFLISGAVDHEAPGVFLSFEESEDELYADVASLNRDLRKLVAHKKIVIDHVVLNQKDLQYADFNLEGILIRLEHVIDSVGAKRVVLDSIESLFAGMIEEGRLRSEIKRLFRWLKEKKVTTIVTGEPSGKDSYTRHGLEQYVSDCVIFLDHRVNAQVSIRRLRVVKYRGSRHGTNEYPFVIDDRGLSVIPITSAALSQPGTAERVSTGIPSLDKLFNDKAGFTRGSTVLISGTAGTGKTSLAAAFAVSTCERGERCLFLSYEESAGQLAQNLGSIGIDFEHWIQKGLLKVVATRPTFFGLEMHLLDMYKLIEEFDPQAMVIDPLTSLLGEGDEREVRSMVTRVIDLLKSKFITGVFTSLVPSTARNDTSGEIGVSSLIDTWIIVRELEEESTRKRIRGLFIVKSRGTSHSSDVQLLELSDHGIGVRTMAVGAPEARKKIGPMVPTEHAGSI